MFAIDTHVHLLVSKAAKPDWDEIAFATQAAGNDGLTTLCITEHLDALHYPALIRGLFLEQRLGGRLLSPGVLKLANGLCLSCGAEVSIGGGGDIGVHAEPEVLLGLDQRKGAYSLADLIGTLRSQPSPFAMVAHHVYWPGKSIAALTRQARNLDALELPAKDWEHVDQYLELAADLALPVVGGSDAHTWIQIGSARSIAQVAPDEQFSPGRLCRLLKDGAIRAQTLASAAERIRLSGILRTRLDTARRPAPAAGHERGAGHAVHA